MSLIWLFLVMSLLTPTVNADTVEPPETRGYIFVGDSRTVGMEEACHVSEYDNVFVVAKVGKGYYWLVNTAWQEVESIKSSNPGVDRWTIVSNLGVNDLGSWQNYINFYQSLEDDFVFVSVNPVRNYDRVSNISIDKFNMRIREAGFEYIDTNLILRAEGFSAPDGLHYSSSTYRLIFGIISRELGVV